MQNKKLTALLLLLVLSMLLSACVGTPPETPPTPGGDTPNGDTPGGDTPNGDAPGGDRPNDDHTDKNDPAPPATPGYSENGIFGGSETEIPTLRISVKDGATIESRDTYLKATVSCDGKNALLGVGASVRGRGNSSWEYFEKKSYRLKFDKKQDLLGMGAAKDFVLVSSAMDLSFMQNYAALRLSAALGSDYTPECAFAHVYLNGKYNGLYLVCERIEEDEERLDIGNGLQGGVDVGYLVEFGGNVDRTEKNLFQLYPVEHEGRRYAWRDSFFGVVKSPDEDVCTAAQMAYITDYLNRVNTAIFKKDFNTFSSLCDVDSFATYVLVNELFLNNDLDFSYYMYKKPGGKLYLGPVWDFDQSCGMSEKVGNRYTGWSVNQYDCWVTSLLDMPQFREWVMDKWVQNYALIHAIPTDITAKATYMRADIHRNYRRWSVIGQPYWRMTEECAAYTTYDQFLSRLTLWLENRMKWIDGQFKLT